MPSTFKRRSTSQRHSVAQALDNFKDLERTMIRKTKIRDLLRNPDYKNMSRKACHRQLWQFSKPDSEKICNCLNEKNGDMTVEELETATNNKEETPGSSCVLLYDEIYRKSKKKVKKTKHKKPKHKKRRPQKPIHDS